MAAKRLPLKHDLRSLFSDKAEEGRGLEHFIGSSVLEQNPAATKATDNTVQWQPVLERIKKKSNPQVFFWFAPLEPLSETEDRLVLKANSEFDRDWINNHYLEFINDTVKEVHGKRVSVMIEAREEGLAVAHGPRVP